MDNSPELFDIYLAEMSEHLEILNESLLALEKNPAGKDLVNVIFRAFHTMKGSTATMGYVKSAELIHKMEDILQTVRDGKIIIEAKLIQLLFVCHDFIEKFITLISKKASEDGIETKDLFNLLNEYKSNQGDTNPPSKPEAAHKINQLMLKPAELDYINRRIHDGYKAYRASMKITEECQFKAVRVWMTFEELEQLGEIIKSYPIKPSQEDFIDSSFNITDTAVKAVIISEKSSDDILSDLNSTLMEIENILVEEYNPEDEMDPNLIQNIIEGTSEGQEMLLAEEEYQIYVEEIRKQISRSELFCLDSISNLEDATIIDKIWHSFVVIKEISASIGQSTIYNIALESENLLNNFRRQKIKMERQHLDILVKSFIYIKQLCDNASIELDNDFLENIKEHLNSYSRCRLGEFSELTTTEEDRAMSGMKLGEILIKKNVLDEGSVNMLLEKQNSTYPGLHFGKVALKEEKACLKDVVDALNIQNSIKPGQKPQSFIRVPEQKVDGMVDMLGELLIVQSNHKKELSDLLCELRITDMRVLNNILRMERITKDIQTTSMSLRMVSLKQSFQKLLRIGRDTAAELHRNVNIEISGDETEIDRSVVEKIQDPMMHLIRNAISHGIENEEERLLSNKPQNGTVIIRAYNKRGFIYIEIGDDGKGLNIEKIYEKAKAKNLIDPTKNYTDEEIIRFIYLPGFSTQEDINSISGRGVGMNVVETEINKIGGKIEILNKPGYGCTFILKIPVNLATINGTILDIFGGRYILPTLNIKQILKPLPEQWVTIKGKTEIIKIRNDVLQIVPIDKILGINKQNVDYKDGMIIVIELDKMLKALPVSSVLDKQEIVVKPLNSEFRGLNFASGATILGDGKVSLILDLESMFRFNTFSS